MADSIAQPAPTSKDMIESSLELAAGIAELDNLIERHVEEFRRVKEQRDALLDALLAARQFLAPDIARGPAANGWVNTVALVNAALSDAEGR